MFEFAGQWEEPVNYVFLMVTAIITWHGLTYRDADGKGDLVRVLFACIAATFFFLVLFQDVLGLVRLS